MLSYGRFAACFRADLSLYHWNEAHLKSMHTRSDNDRREQYTQMYLTKDVLSQAVLRRTT